MTDEQVRQRGNGRQHDQPDQQLEQCQPVKRGVHVRERDRDHQPGVRDRYRPVRNRDNVDPVATVRGQAEGRRSRQRPHLRRGGTLRRVELGKGAAPGRDQRGIAAPGQHALQVGGGVVSVGVVVAELHHERMLGGAELLIDPVDQEVLERIPGRHTGNQQADRDQHDHDQHQSHAQRQRGEPAPHAQPFGSRIA